jgi:hypothetical protein
MREFKPCTNSFAPLLAYASLLLSKNANAWNADSSFQQLLLGRMVDMVRHASLARRGTYRFNTGNLTTGLVAIRLSKFFEDEEFVWLAGPDRYRLPSYRRGVQHLGEVRFEPPFDSDHLTNSKFGSL